MNVEWALRELRQFMDLSKVVQRTEMSRNREALDQAFAAAYVAERILDRVLSGWRESPPDGQKGLWQREREAARLAIVKLEHDAALEENLGPDTPLLDARLMHPWVWEGAKPLWQSGHLREAVRVASVKVNAEVQNKLGRRDASEVALLQSAYSQDEPKPGQPRLRLPDDDGGKTALSVRRGVVALAEGCYAALRNPSSHDVLDELPEVEALEQLAAFSLLARFVDRSEVRFAV